MQYKDKNDFLDSDKYKEIKIRLHESESVGVPMEEEFDIDSIDFNEVPSYPISWGVSGLDIELGGQPKGKYQMIYGGPSTGKTTYTLQLAIENAKLNNRVRYISLEMPKRDFILQNMRTRAGIKHKGVGDGMAPSFAQKEIMKDFIKDIKLINIVGYVNQPSFQEFKAIMNSLKMKGDDLIIIDNLGMIGRGDDIDELKLYGMVSAFIKDFVDETGVSVTILHHTNKGSETSNGKRGFSSFRGNGKIADDCDYVIQLQREYLDSGGTETTIKIEKDRIGGNNGYAIRLEFDRGVFIKGVFQ